MAGSDSSMHITHRERGVRAARRRISDERLTAFLWAIQDDQDVYAAQLIRRDLDGGKSLDAIFYTGDEYGFSLSVRRVSEFSFDIRFGCQAGPLAGDGGEWRVSFDGDRVRSIDARSAWVS
jgi:hypothetical protein